MAVDPEVADLASLVRAGTHAELMVLTAQGLLPVPLTQLVELQVYLAEREDAELSPVAAHSLRQLEPAVAASVVEESSIDVVSYLARNHGHPSVVERALQLRQLPTAVMRALAPRLSAELQEILLLRQDAIVDDPGILEALETNPQLSSYARRRIAEYRQHLLPREAAAPEPEPEPEPEFELEEVPEIDRPWAPLAADAGEVAVEEEELAEVEALGTDGMSELQIRTLPTAVRLQLSRGASRTLRSILIRDTNPAVALSVLSSNPLGESELEAFASSRNVSEEILDSIGRNPKWVRKYKIVRALVGNPRTPVGLAVRLTGRLSVRDLRTLGRDRNIPEAVRSTAQRLYRIKLK